MGEALLGLGSRPSRTMMGIVGVSLAIGALIATAGLSQTTSGQVRSRFSDLGSPYVRIEAAPLPDGPAEATVISVDAAEGVIDLPGVESAAIIQEFEGVDVSSHREAPTLTVTVAATGPSVAPASGLVVAGRFFDEGHLARKDQVVVVGSAVARRMELSDPDGVASLLIGGRRFVVMGIIEEAPGDPQLLSSVVVPSATFAQQTPTATRLLVMSGTDRVQDLAASLAIALDPQRPGRFLPIFDAGSPTLERDVLRDLDALVLSLVAVSALVSGMTVANMTTLAVSERVREIGLRRSLGAGRRHIAWQFIIEGTLVGLGGAAAGVLLGVGVLVGVARLRGLEPLIDPLVVWGSFGLGTLVGLVASILPSLGAARQDPMRALTAGT